MKFKSLLIFALFLTFPMLSFQHTSAPDPEDFAKKLLELIRKNNKEEYLKSFSITYQDVLYMRNIVENDVHVSPEEKAEWSRKLEDTTKLTNINEALNEGYNQVMEWVRKESINLNELEYVRMYYKMDYEQRGHVHVLERVLLFVKFKEKYYCLGVSQVAYLNGRWAFGEIREINEYDQYLEYAEGGYGNNADDYDSYGLDSTSVDTAMAAPDEYYEIDSAAAEPVLTKKQQKLEKKIAAQQKKLCKLLDEKYKE